MKKKRTSKKRAAKPAGILFPRESFAFIAHELKGTLAAAMQNMFALKGGYFGPVTAEQQNVLTTSLAYLGYYESMMKNLFAFGRIEEKMFIPVRTPVDIAPVIAGAAEASRKAAEARGMTITVDAPSCIVSADSGMLSAALMNLIGNAVAFGAPDSVITIHTRTDARTLTVDVYNDGTPIPEASVSKLFRRFSRLDRGGERVPGTGLGLYIVRTIVKAHGGTISCIPRTAGNSFVFTLPIFNTIRH